MKINYLRFCTLPMPVRSFCFNNNGWIVGGGARWLLGIEHKSPRDWDILIPLENWDKACKSFPLGSKTNSFGGVKLLFEHGTIEVDVWGDSLSNYIQSQNQHPNYAVSLNGFHSLMFNNNVHYPKDDKSDEES